MPEFYSILFASPADEQPLADRPPFFDDLNLGQIICEASAEIEDKALAALYYTPLASPEAVAYRQKIAKELEQPDLLAASRDFLLSQKRMGDMLSARLNAKTAEQAAKWLLDAASEYCLGVEAYAAALNTLELRAGGLLSLRDYLAGYISSPAYRALAADTAARRADMDEIAYCLEFDQGKVMLELTDKKDLDSLPDVCRELAAAFEPMSETKYEYTLSLFPGYDLTALERETADIMKKNYPGKFAALGEYAAKRAAFADKKLLRLARELNFYISYHNFAQSYRAKGMSMCYPEVSGEKEIAVVGGYDLALAMHSGERPAEVVVSNDFQLLPGERIFILTGPNQGGKTTFARAYGQIMYLASLGLPVPARSAKLFLARRIFTHFATEEDLGSHSGRLQEELLRLREITSAAGGDSLLIFNELFATTTTYDAIRLAGRTIEWVKGLDALCIYVSHIAEIAECSEGTVSLVAELASADNPERTFRIRRRRADGAAYANTVARKYRLTYEDIKARKGI